MADDDSTNGDRGRAVPATKKAAAKKKAAKKTSSQNASAKKASAKKTSAKKTSAKKKTSAGPTATRKKTATQAAAASQETAPASEPGPVPETRAASRAPDARVPGAAEGAPPGAATSSPFEADRDEESGWTGLLALWGPLAMLAFVVLIFVGDEPEGRPASAPGAIDHGDEVAETSLAPASPSAAVPEPGPEPVGEEGEPDELVGEADRTSMPEPEPAPATEVTTAAIGPEPVGEEGEPDQRVGEIAEDPGSASALRAAFEEAGVATEPVTPPVPADETFEPSGVSAGEDAPRAGSAEAPPPPPGRAGSYPAPLPGGGYANPWAPAPDPWTGQPPPPPPTGAWHGMDRGSGRMAGPPGRGPHGGYGPHGGPGWHHHRGGGPYHGPYPDHGYWGEAPPAYPLPR